MVHRVRLLPVLNEKGLVHVTVDAALLTVCGRGNLGLRASVAVCHNKPDGCVLHKTQVVEEHRARVGGAKRDAVLLECKFHPFLLYYHFQENSTQHPFLMRLLALIILFSWTFHLMRSSRRE